MVHALLLVLAAAGVVLAALLFLAALAFSLRIAFLFPEAAQWASEFGEPYLYPLTDPPLVQLAQATPFSWPPEISYDNAMPLALAVGCLALAFVMTLIAAHTGRFAERIRKRRETAPAAVVVTRASADAAPRAPMPRLPTAPQSAASAYPVRPAPQPAPRPPQPVAAADTVLNVAARKQMIGRYEIVDELGRGAMGVVYRARDPAIDRVVAMKTYIGADDEFRVRFEREARAAGKLSHSGVVTIHDLVKDDSGQPHIVMEFVDGTTLTRMLAGKQISYSRAVEIGIELAQALDYAHGQGLVHRDIKPDNIIIAKDGRAKIMDFGIARMGSADLTQAGQILGTPSFMAPEQYLSSRVDSRADLFSLGSTLYLMFTGEKPFRGKTAAALADAITTSDPRPPSVANAHLPVEIDGILKKCLEKKPEDRYQSARELAVALKALPAGGE
ncbi:MAG: serine/threonine-protein kinase [Nevskiaceae bacterium]